MDALINALWQPNVGMVVLLTMLVLLIIIDRRRTRAQAAWRRKTDFHAGLTRRDVDECFAAFRKTTDKLEDDLRQVRQSQQQAFNLRKGESVLAWQAMKLAVVCLMTEDRPRGDGEPALLLGGHNGTARLLYVKDGQWFIHGGSRDHLRVVDQCDPNGLWTWEWWRASGLERGSGTFEALESLLHDCQHVVGKESIRLEMKREGALEIMRGHTQGPRSTIVYDVPGYSPVRGFEAMMVGGVVVFPQFIQDLIVHPDGKITVTCTDGKELKASLDEARAVAQVIAARDPARVGKPYVQFSADLKHRHNPKQDGPGYTSEGAGYTGQSNQC